MGTALPIYLAHPFLGTGLPDGPWRSSRQNTERVRALAVGIDETMPRFAPRYSHGRAAEGLDEEAVLRWCFRLIEGDPEPERYVPAPGERRTTRGAGAGGPFGPLALPPCLLPRVGQVWVVGPVSRGMAAEIAHAEALGIPVVEFDADEQQDIIGAGRASVARRAQGVTQRVVSAVLAGLFDRPDFRGARAVVEAYFLAESWVLGGGAINYEKRLGSGVQNASGAMAFRSSVEEQALRLVRASALFLASGLSEPERVALRARELEGHTYRRVALALGWPDDSAAEERARRLASRAIAKVRDALRDNEAQQEVAA